MTTRPNPMRTMMNKRAAGEKTGMPSYCTANQLVIEAILQRTAVTRRPVLIEATANQVNQEGGYTGMRPAEYYRWVLELAAQHGVSEDLIILAGDHLGPLTFTDLPEREAMAKAKVLVYEYARAGFTKIHLDTSMKVADDPAGPLATGTVARRGKELYDVAMKAYRELLKEVPDAPRPVFVIGSEVPIPGGAQEAEDTLAVTKPEDFADTVETYLTFFGDAMEDVIAVVVQPGVEFGDDQIFLYDHDKAAALTAKLKDYPGLVFEGHSTDYQSRECLRQMVEDGVGILKVGPALTYAMREAIFALSMIEKELLPEEKQAHVMESLDQVMLESPANWIKHYHGTEKECCLARKYSFSDRARYYIGDSRVQDTITKLFANLRSCEIPMNMLHQYMPLQYIGVRNGSLPMEPRALVKDAVRIVCDDYNYATRPNFVAGSLFI